MKSKIKQCQNCKAEFTIYPDDQTYYEKIGVQEPRPGVGAAKNAILEKYYE